MTSIRVTAYFDAKARTLDRAMLLTSVELARNALNAAPDAMLIVDAAGAIRYASLQVTTLFGYAHDEIVGQSVDLLVPERFRAHHVGYRRRYWNSMRARAIGAGLELFGRRKDGTEFPVEISLSPIQDEQGTFVAAVIRDVTDRKRIESQLVQARDAAERARELADRANQSKSRFLATASHDLRQPLQTLEFLNGSLRRLTTSETAAEVVAQQSVTIAAMSRLLNALLDISKLESGAIQPHPTDFAVAAVFEELRREFAATAASKELQLQVSVGEECAHSDPSLIEQLLRNLVSNAIKYTKRGLVSLRCLASADTTLRLEVIDTGIGIPAEQIQHIYEEFYQVGVATNSSREGYGLGLTIVQRIVELLELRLDVSSEIGKGSVFSLSVPASAVGVVRAREAAPEPGFGQPSVGALGVLLVEDDKSVRDATCLLLTVEGYHVTGVATLAQALEHARRGNAIDLLVTDYHLANGETGTAVIAALRKSLGAHLKAVIITGDTSTALRELPRDPFLRTASKPVQADQLLTLMRTLLAA